MKRSGKVMINMVLGGLLAAALSVITIPFLAERQFDAGKKLELTAGWPGAEVLYRKAVGFDPFDARYMEALADLLLRKNAYQKDAVQTLSEAEALYGRARKLNPMHGDYTLKLAQVRLKLFLTDRERFAEKLKDGMGNFKEAVSKDPKGFNISYSAGYAGIAVWEFLNDDEKSFILGRLKYTLKLKRWYWVYIYPCLWEKTKNFEILKLSTPDNLAPNKDLLYFLESNGLYQFRQVQSGVVDSYRRKEEPQAFLKKREEKSRLVRDLKKSAHASRAAGVIKKEQWESGVVHGEGVYKGGEMYWAGTINGLLDVPRGEALLIIKARGTRADNIYPYMTVELDGEEIGGAYVDSADWKEYTFHVRTDGGLKVTSVNFLNDAVDEERREDRNLFIDEAMVKI